ncbi:hypothetical protein HII31_08295 [Pseudocercospora fuligena]|uniref:Uncharacterized protein n=1 Tax=Pseudocercospora fuligena TaxID=685502 RepID=A0A8H6VH76_9PEZI|nr:hypothetical protein HII31_08295 [Pseudocercospora fuligena]
MITDDLLLFVDRGTFLADFIIDFLILELNIPIAVAYLDGRPVPSEDIIDEWRSLVFATIAVVEELDSMMGPVGPLDRYPGHSLPGFFLDLMRKLVESPGPAVKKFLAKSNEQILQEHADRRNSSADLPWNSEDFLARIPLAAAGLAVRVTLWLKAKEQIASGRLLEYATAEEQDVQDS